MMCSGTEVQEILPEGGWGGGGAKTLLSPAVEVAYT